MRVGVHSALTQCCCIAGATAVPMPALLSKLLMMHCKHREISHRAGCFEPDSSCAAVSNLTALTFSGTKVSLRRIHPRNATQWRSKCDCGRASRRGFQKRCSDRHRSSSAVHQDRVFTFHEDVGNCCHSGSRCITRSKTRRVRCQRGGNVDRLEFDLVPAAVLTRARHERALIGHREPGSGRSHAASSGQPAGRSRLRQ